ncbi:MAG: lysylphosphatidylglycerol synthase domain-containing protein, partial [Acutalibacteraceae bacterium]|nr:lysylphosphatidylglycerol synthase domain-containing protein [Acutalibacteraceae bacterium]
MKAFLLKYRVVDILTLCIAIGVFLALYGNVPALFAGVSVAQVLVIILTALLVHVLKATRLFLALYGQKISISEHLALYCKVTPVSMVLPYKVGEFYRMYAYGTHLKSGLKGIVIILLDRFMDTAALVTMILIAGFFYGGQITSFL